MGRRIFFYAGKRLPPVASCGEGRYDQGVSASCRAAAYCWRLGGRMVKSRRFPPPGVPVIRDTPVLHDLDAERRGRRLQMCAVFLVAATCALTVQLWLVAADRNAYRAAAC